MKLNVTGLSFSYPSKSVLRSVHTGDIPSGKLTALLGPNAAGKSTLFRCISGLLTPQTGQVFLGDEQMQLMEHASRIRHICYMPQSYASQAALTVFEVVLLACKHLNDWQVTDQDIDVVSNLLERFAISHLADCYIGELSGGQQQVVALCQSMVRPAKLFLLDEPTSALDLRRQLEVMHTLSEITDERDVTTVIAMHDLNLAARFADHLVLMNDGEVVAAGSTEDVLSSQALAATYGVNIELQRASDGVMMVGASLC